MSLRTSHLRSALLTVLAALGMAALVHTQQAAPSAADSPSQMSEFFEAIDVDIVNVEVFVSDKKGNPIPGLTQDDFTVFEDGDRQEITNFFAGEEVRATVDAVGQALPLAAESEVAPAAESEREVNAEQRLNLIVFIDNRNISPVSRNRVLAAVRDSMFQDLAPTDRVTLVSYDGSLKVRRFPTANVESLLQGVEDLATGSATGQQRSVDKLSLIRQMNQFDLDNFTSTSSVGFSGSAGPDIAGVESELQTYAQREFDEIRATVAALSQFVSVLAGIPGRKALVYISDGLSTHPAEALYQALERASRQFGGSSINASAESRQFETTSYFEDLGKQANSGRVTIYSILARGRNQTVSGAERSAFFSLGDPTSLGQLWDDTLETIDYSNSRGSMEILAASTGGRATLAALDFDSAIANLKRDFDSYYSLGYRSPHDDDKDHRIEVKVSNKDWKIRHRETQRRRTADEIMASHTRSALMLDSGENPLGVKVEFGEPQQHKRKQWLVPVIVKFPIARLVLLPGESFHQGKVAIYVGAQGPGGDLSPIQKMQAPIRVPNDQLLTAMSQVAGYRMTLLMRPGEHRVAVTVRDELADVSSAAVVSHTPQIPSDETPGEPQLGTL